nr:MCE family protein [Actinokineospora alba]
MRDRDPAAAGVVSIVLIGLVAAAALFSEDLPLIGGGTDYRAEFTESAGLKDGNEVRVAGVKVGRVEDVSLDGDHVRVDFRVDDVWVGDRSTASIEIKTLLGEKYLALDPLGEAEQNPDEAIPRARTRAPFDLNTAFNQLAETVDELDVDALAKSMDTMSQAFADTPRHLRGAMDGLSALAKTISSRDQQLTTLLSNTRQVSATLAERDSDIATLIADGNLLLAELQARKDVIHNLLVGVRELSTQLSGLVADNREHLKPALTKLDRIAGILARNQDNLARGVAAMAPFVRVFNNTVGSGRWFDSYMCGLAPASVDAGLLAVNPHGCLPPKSDTTTLGGR